MKKEANELDETYISVSPKRVYKVKMLCKYVGRGNPRKYEEEKE